MKWRMFGYKLKDLIVEADSFDKALAKAREINDNYIGGQRNITNYERIKEMSVEEMAEFIDSLRYCSTCARNGNSCFLTFRTEEWLNKEVEEC